MVTASGVAVDMTSGVVLHDAWNLIFRCNHKSPTCPPVATRDSKALTQRVTCSPDTTNQFVTCSTTSRNRAVPPSVLNYLVQAFLAWNHNLLQASFKPETRRYYRQIRYDKQAIAATKTQLARDPANANLLGSLELLQTDKANQITALNTLQTQITNDEGFISVPSPAVEQKAPVSPHPLRNSILGGIVGIGLAAALIVLLEYLDDTFRSADEILESTNLPLIGSVRKYEGTADEMATVAARMPRTAIAEAYRVARANIQFTEIGGNLEILVVTSARDGEGKTTTANNLATTFALAGQRVLLVDGDLRRPGLTKLMGMRDSHGLSSALLDPDAQVVSATDVMGLSVVPSGAIPPNPSELLGSQRMRSFVENAAENYDLVILDTPPVLSVADTRILATVADGVILVLDPAITTRRMVRQARLAVENVGGRILGIMLNRDVMRGEGYYYNYYYYERRRERDRTGFAGLTPNRSPRSTQLTPRR